MNVTMLDSRAMVWIPGGIFEMGSDSWYPEEAPVHLVEVQGFSMDRLPVSNADFAAFVAETGYVTVAEGALDGSLYPGVPAELLQPGSMVFQMTSGPVSLSNPSLWWRSVPGASWRCPSGPGSDSDCLPQHPVVHVAYEDALAYAAWMGKSLPSEAEWEFAARGGLAGGTYPWGEEFAPEGRRMANVWNGEFPWESLTAGGPPSTTPVGSFPANTFELFDMIGNVWEWTTDWYAPLHQTAKHSCCIAHDPRGPGPEESFDPLTPTVQIPRKVIKGGSFLCAANFCQRYRPAARSAQSIDSSTCHIGFRCIVRPSC